MATRRNMALAAGLDKFAGFLARREERRVRECESIPTMSNVQSETIPLTIISSPSSRSHETHEDRYSRTPSQRLGYQGTTTIAMAQSVFTTSRLARAGGDEGRTPTTASQRLGHESAATVRVARPILNPSRVERADSRTRVPLRATSRPGVSSNGGRSRC